MKKIIVILLSVLAFTACKKNNPKPPVKPVLSNRLLLSKSVSTESDVDTSNNRTIFYTYNDSNKLVKELVINKNNGNIGADTTRYTYDAQGNLTNVQERQYPSLYGSITNIYYTNGLPDYRIVKTLYGSLIYTDTTTYKVVNGQVTQFGDSELIKYTNNNVAGFSATNVEGSTKYTYNTNKGPFYLSHFQWVLLDVQTVATSEYNQNAIVSEYATGADGFTSTVAHKNTYNTQGYLTKTSYTNITTGPTSGDTDDSSIVYTTVYTYINAK